MTNNQQRITDDLDAMLAVFSPELAQAVHSRDHFDQLIEVILDLGRKPSARFFKEELTLLERPVAQEDLDYILNRIGDFDADNRAGMERTLHRISAIRNRRGKIVGLTCRIGRAVYGTIDIIHDLVESGESILILGRPGVGKTTMLREAARILAESKRVVIVDTSNEIGGDGDVPHPAVGNARRMQVPKPSLQHEVMIEAVENHNPEVIIIDEIGRELEALAARTIAERGVQLIGTAHGTALENLLMNPTLSDLVGGIESVTLSDDEARRRGTQKTVLERRSPPTFTVLVEILTRDRVAVHKDVASAVDSILRGYPIPAEERYWDEKGKIRTVKAQAPAPTASQSLKSGNGMEKSPFQRTINAAQNAPVQAQGRANRQKYPSAFTDRQNSPEREAFRNQSPFLVEEPFDQLQVAPGHGVRNIYAYGVARNRLIQVIKAMNVPARVVRTPEEADTFVTQRRYYREHLQPITDAEEKGIPIFVIKSNTDGQIEQFLADLFSLRPAAEFIPAYNEALSEAEEAIGRVYAGEKYVDLGPVDAPVRRKQHEMAKQANLVSQSFGKEPNRRVRIFRD
ncbi:MAG: R3H domain-containing nucleic acid-binding protein [Anaerolineaceae bacterium]|nr:R3H domain-containing nucleic acid-binding protein [Anaerolineaceae bacterium]